MDREMIIFRGLHCKINTKAAFVDMCIGNSALAAKILESPVIAAECGKRACSLKEEERNGIVALRVELNEEKREQIYEDIFGEKLGDDRFDKLSELNQMLMEPVRMMHKKEIEIDVIPFIVYGVVRNSRCREALLKSVTCCEMECLTAFRGSEYHTTRFLRKFLLDERKAVKLMTGLLLLFGKEVSNEKYRMAMDIIYAGYRPIKNRIKKLDRLEGKQFQDLMEEDMMMELILSRMVIQMVIAEDLDIPWVKDYKLCQVICMLKSYEDRAANPQENEIDMTEGKRIYRRFLKDHWKPGAYYVSEFLEKENREMCEQWQKMEKLLNIFGMETRALYGICLEKWEAEMLCSIFEEKDWERYKDYLLLATLCKYIQQIETMYENDIPEEIQYRKSCEENAVRSMEYERKRMEERIRILEQWKREKEGELAEAERQLEHLKREKQKNEEQREKDREELVKLRKFIFQNKGNDEAVSCVVCDEETDVSCESGAKEAAEGAESFGKMFDFGGLDRSIVIGGHRNWQKKLRQCLPGSQFLASDYMNFDPAVLRNKKYIIVNTDILKHGLYYKIMNERKKEQKILYVHGNNVNRTLREIAEQLG